MVDSFLEKLILHTTFMFKKYGHERNKDHKVYKNLFEILAIIRSYSLNDKKVYVSQLSSLLNQPMSAISRLLGNMEEKGLIIRETDKEDRRNTYILTTERGDALYFKMLNGFKGFLENAFSVLTEEERKTYILLTAKLSGIEGEYNV